MHDGSANPLLSVRYRPISSSKKHCLPSTLCNIVVMEHLDRGNLHQVGPQQQCDTVLSPQAGWDRLQFLRCAERLVVMSSASCHDCQY